MRLFVDLIIDPWLYNTFTTCTSCECQGTKHNLEQKLTCLEQKKRQPIQFGFITCSCCSSSPPLILLRLLTFVINIAFTFFFPFFFIVILPNTHHQKNIKPTECHGAWNRPTIPQSKARHPNSFSSWGGLPPAMCRFLKFSRRAATSPMTNSGWPGFASSIESRKKNPSNTSPPFYWPSSRCEFHLVRFWKTSMCPYRKSQTCKMPNTQMLRESPSPNQQSNPVFLWHQRHDEHGKTSLENENVNPRHRQHEGVKNQCGIKSSKT